MHCTILAVSCLHISDIPQAQEQGQPRPKQSMASMQCMHCILTCNAQSADRVSSALLPPIASPSLPWQPAPKPVSQFLQCSQTKPLHQRDVWTSHPRVPPEKVRHASALNVFLLAFIFFSLSFVSVTFFLYMSCSPSLLPLSFSFHVSPFSRQVYRLVKRQASNCRVIRVGGGYLILSDDWYVSATCVLL